MTKVPPVLFPLCLLSLSNQGQHAEMRKSHAFAVLSLDTKVQPICNIFYAHPEHNENKAIGVFGVFLHFLTLLVYTL